MESFNPNSEKDDVPDGNLGEINTFVFKMQVVDSTQSDYCNLMGVPSK